MLSNYLRRSVRVFTGFVNGGYFAFSIVDLLFGIFFAPLTGGLSLALIGIWAAACAVLFTVKNLRDDTKRKNIQTEAQEKLTAAIHAYEEKFGKDTYQSLPPPLPPPSLKGRLWHFTKKVLNRLREGGRGAKNSTKFGLRLLFLFGVTFSTSLFLAGPWVFIPFAAFAIIFTAACALDYHLTSNQKGRAKALAAECRRADQAIKYGVTLDKLDDHLEKIAKQKIAFTPSKKFTYNKKNIAYFVYTGLVNGGYYGFSITSLIFGIFFAPILGLPAVVLFTPFLLFCTFGIVSKNINDQTRNQKNIYSLESTQEKNQKKLEALQNQHKKLGLAYPEIPPLPTKPNSLQDNAWRYTKKGLSRFRYFGRGAKNSVKLCIGLASFLGVGIVTIVSLGPIAFTIFSLIAVAFAISSGYEYHLKRKDADAITRLKNKNEHLKHEIKILKEALKPKEPELTKTATKEASTQIAIKTIEPNTQKATAPDRITTFELFKGYLRQNCRSGKREKKSKKGYHPKVISSRVISQNA